MKFFKLILTISLMLAFSPMDACCCDHEEGAQEHQCMVMCHISCCGLVVIPQQVEISYERVQSFTTAQEFSYDEPFIPTEYRPPISVS